MSVVPFMQHVVMQCSDTSVQQVQDWLSHKQAHRGDSNPFTFQCCSQATFTSDHHTSHCLGWRLPSLVSPQSTTLWQWRAHLVRRYGWFPSGTWLPNVRSLVRHLYGPSPTPPRRMGGACADCRHHM